MTKTLFMHGMNELSLFFKTFRPTDDQIAAWYKRLKDTEEEPFRLGIFWLTEFSNTAPSYKKIKKALKLAKQKLKGSIPTVRIDGGYAPRSDEKWALHKECMNGLHRVLELRGKAKDDQAQFITKYWKDNYPLLPGYKTEDQVKEIEAKGDYAELARLGVIREDQIPNLRKFWYPPVFNSEKETLDIIEL